MNESFFDFLPRYDLREEAFRKYETMIAKAVRSKLIVDPSTLKVPMKAHTFVARFRDAVRAYKMFKYKSTIIPANASLEFKLMETKGGQVVIYPPVKVDEIEPTFTSKEDFIRLCEELDKVSADDMQPHYLNVPNEEDRKWIQALIGTWPKKYDVVLEWEGTRALLL